jgi:hypothetical protein
MNMSSEDDFEMELGSSGGGGGGGGWGCMGESVSLQVQLFVPLWIVNASQLPISTGMVPLTIMEDMEWGVPSHASSRAHIEAGSFVSGVAAKPMAGESGSNLVV